MQGSNPDIILSALHLSHYTGNSGLPKAQKGYGNGALVVGIQFCF